MASGSSSPVGGSVTAPESSLHGIPEQKMPRVSLSNISKSFPGQRALDDVSFDIWGGEIQGLLGENGSGKSTLIKVLAGQYQPDPGGTVTVRSGDEVVAATSATQTGAIVARFVHQGLGLIDDLTAVENVALQTGFVRSGFRRINRRKQERLTVDLIDRLGVPLDINRPVGELSGLQRTCVAVGRALNDIDQGDALLVLDEPTTSLSVKEIDRLFEILLNLRNHGTAILFVSHDLEDVARISDRVTVLRDGRVVASGPMSAFSRSKDSDALAEAIVGRAIERARDSRRSAAVAEADPALQVRDLSGEILAGFHLDLQPGECVGIAGLDDSGRRELPYLIAGDRRATSGHVAVSGVREERPTISSTRRNGLRLLPGDRDKNGTVPHMSARENLTLAGLRFHRMSFRITRRRETSVFNDAASRLNISPKSPEMDIDQFSGGNRQKILLGRQMQGRYSVLILDDPTVGVDIGARETLYDALRVLRESGVAMVVISSDAEELAGICDRVVILRDGQAVCELMGESLTAHSIVHELLGGEIEISQNV